VNALFNRISNVSYLDIISLDDTSTLQIGDSEKLKPSANVLAVQREKGVFWENEFRFRDFPLFHEKIPEPYLDEQVFMIQKNENPLIQVKNVKVSFLAASSNIHIGSTQKICAKAKVLNIRHLIRE
jgi:spore germination protein PE